MFVYLDMSEISGRTYRPDLQNLQTRRQKLRKQLIFRTELSINVKTKNTLKYKNCVTFLKCSKCRPFN